MKKITSLFVALTVVATAFADVLLWQVPTSPISNASDPGGTSWNGSWSYAMLKHTSNTDLNYYTAGSIDENNQQDTTYYGGEAGDNLTTWGADSSLNGSTITTAYGADGGVRRGGGWYIALYDNSDNLVGFSQLMLDEQVQRFRATSHNISSWETANGPMQGTGWTAAPEPTSGVLLLLGAAVLGLRRRKVA